MTMVMMHDGRRRHSMPESLDLGLRAVALPPSSARQVSRTSGCVSSAHLVTAPGRACERRRSAQFARPPPSMLALPRPPSPPRCPGRPPHPVLSGCEVAQREAVLLLREGWWPPKPSIGRRRSGREDERFSPHHLSSCVAPTPPRRRIAPCCVRHGCLRKPPLLSQSEQSVATVGPTRETIVAGGILSWA